jgi:hypothetical protein
MAEFAINDLGITQVAVIHDGDTYTEGLANIFIEAFLELGGELVTVESVDANTEDVTPTLDLIAAVGPPQLLYYPVFMPLGAHITKQAQEVAGLENVILVASDAIQTSSFIEETGADSEGMYFSGPDLKFISERYDRFLLAYQEKFGSEPMASFHAHAFDAVSMILDGIEQVAQVADDGTLLIGRQALRDALFATSGMVGLTGTITCDVYGDCADARVVISQIIDGEFMPISSISGTFLPAPTSSLIMGCVVNGPLYVWLDNQIESNTCDQYARGGFELQTGDEVRILDKNAILVFGPDSSCLSNKYIKIQSTARPAITGWAMERSISVLEPGESCQP